MTASATPIGKTNAPSVDARLAARANARDIADQFEKLFVKELMAGFRKTAGITGEGGNLFGSGPGADTYSQWFDDNLGDHLASNGRLGVADTLMQEFERWQQIPAAPRPEELGPTIPVIDQEDSMSLHDAAERLIRCLQTTCDRLQGLQRAMSDRRTAWMALRPGQLEQSVDELEKVAAECTILAGQRDEILAELASHLGRTDARGLRIGAIAARLPHRQANRLRIVAEAAARHAKSLHAEGTLGGRLLEFSRQTQEGMFRSLVSAPADSARSYDRNARVVSGLGTNRVAGAILDGKL